MYDALGVGNDFPPIANMQWDFSETSLESLQFLTLNLKIQEPN